MDEIATDTDGIEGLSLTELEELESATRYEIRKHSSLSGADTDQHRFEGLHRKLRQIHSRMDELQEASYNPGPEDPPGYEPRGYSARAGFVKSNPRNNGYYIEQFKTDPWYPAISAAHESLEKFLPGYNIAQIKEKFGGLRYYFDYPEPIPAETDQPAFSNYEKIRVMAHRIVERAESWVDGYEYAKREALKEEEG